VNDREKETRSIGKFSIIWTCALILFMTQTLQEVITASPSSLLLEPSILTE